MLNSNRTFVNALKRYCAERDIRVEVKSDGWLLVMHRGPNKHFAYGYDIGLNSAIAHRIANDKAAASDVFQSCGVPYVPHHLFLKPDLRKYSASQSGTWEAMLSHLDENPSGLVVKPNEGTSGNLVFRVRDKSELESAVNRIFGSNLSIVVSPYLEIADEIRVILIDHVPTVVYSKRRPAVIGDGIHSLLELVVKSTNAERLLAGMANDLDRAALDRVLPAGQSLTLNWRHNLELGATPVLLEQGELRESCVRLAIRGVEAIGMRFGSVDVVRVNGVDKILEINSGVMMEGLGRLHPDLVYAVYRQALDKLFET
jgi:glutathione synthase/RimK-type ligase-like ATP-grasp enzyme